ncbi:MAG: bifunctional (p)ppGpp synthetase/guanosine-3',5'-bis(diphosphate) 3'-pyrophosphohydrolase [Planctomycetes bacterium]|nr:bifunctional (p)ppGpp synthetase/guanosine-3',5'-bis(diphosphate) 3'-pyrophosphohydrolase [Planctomycetota bacterium]
MFDTSLWQEACAFAARAHLHQLRRDGKTPYFSHCVRVALTVALKFDCTDEKILAAALLHDVIEDTTVDYDEVLHHFGKEIADIVAALSKDMRMIESKREPAYDAQLAAGPWEARLIKLADVFDNITDADTEKAQQMLVGKAHRALKLAEGDPKLASACDIVEELIGKVQANGIK